MYTALAQAILENAEPKRWQRAVDAWAARAYTITLTYPDAHRVCGTVTNGEGMTYQTAIGAAGFHACSCPDAVYRAAPCKHVLALCLTVIRALDAQPVCAWCDERGPVAPLAMTWGYEPLVCQECWRDETLRRQQVDYVGDLPGWPGEEG